MPAQIAHLLFAEEALLRALGAKGEALLQRQGGFLRFGSQGPDFFFHNQRLRPTGMRYGIAIHREGYGRLVSNLVREVRRRIGRQEESPSLEALKAFTLGFSAHPFLDRKTHPYIKYFSGWVEAGRGETRRYFRCHVFLERILDVLLLEKRRKLEIRNYRLAPLLHCGDQLPYALIKILVKALHASYPLMRYKSRDRKRIENAYREAQLFYMITEPSVPLYRRMAFQKDLSSLANRKLLTLFHPLRVPEGIDFLNLKKREWVHPCDDRLASRSSFLELYEEALAQAAPALAAVWETLAGNLQEAELEPLIGNGSLETGLDEQAPCTPRFSDPLPLPELIEELYSSFEPRIDPPGA